MLYAENMMFTKLSTALSNIGIPDKSVEVLSELMNMSNEADYSLLDSVDPCTLGRSVEWKLHEAVTKAVKTEILREKNDDLTDRYYNWAFAAAGLSCIWLIYENYYSEYTKEIEQRIAQALGKRFGAEEGKAAAYACELSRTATEEKSYGRITKPKAPSICMKAVDHLGKDPDKVALLTLCIYTLNGSDPSKPQNDDVKKALDIVLGLAENNKALSLKAHDYLLVALGEAAYYSDKAKKLFFRLTAVASGVAVTAAELSIDHSRILDLVETEKSIIRPDYITFVFGCGAFDHRSKRLERLAKNFPELFKKAILEKEDPRDAKRLEEYLIKADGSYSSDQLDLKGSIQRKICDLLSSTSQAPLNIKKYLNGISTFEEMYPDGSKLPVTAGRNNFNYIKAFGEDDFSRRLLTLLMIADIDYGRTYRIRDIAGLDVEHTTVPKIISSMLSCGAPIEEAINSVGLCIDDLYYNKSESIDAAAAESAKYPDKIADINTKRLCATGRVILTKAYGRHPSRFSEQLKALTDDSSKAVKAELLTIYTKSGDESFIKELLKAKKQGKRELALQIIEKKGADNFKEELKAAFDAEKSEKLKTAIGAMLGFEEASAQQTENSIDDLIKKSKKSFVKLAWLFAYPFKPVKMTDGSEAEQDYLKTLLVCYSGMTKAARSITADQLTEKLDKADLEVFAGEVFAKWCDNGAQAKQKWVLYFCAAHGGSEMVRNFIHSIKQWAENMRGAIAAEAVRAMALDGSSEALMAIDSMSRKFKNKQVRSAAAETLANAAEQLGITTEELADRIVPDLGFDENLCRVFDYGSRQFCVYLRPSLELEIICGEKTVKTMPKPGAKDDAEKANAAYNDFKEMKKQIKTAVTAQRARLEYVMMCDRLWTSDSWKTLFVGNALMHCFAIGLIWGIYEDGKLTSTFRYMEDGSFTTSDGDEFELPENASIGLVHPLDLTEEECAEWREQLSDFEITQPFAQLDRKIYRPTEEELNLKRLVRFKDCEINSLSLIGKMTKLGWEKGQAEDAGWFMYFVRRDITSCVRRDDGGLTLDGNAALLTFSGASIVNYDFEGEDVQIEKLGFCKPGKIPYNYEKDCEEYIDIADISPRYFSEIVMQLTSILGDPSQKTDENGN